MAEDALRWSTVGERRVLSLLQKLDLELNALNHFFVLVEVRLVLAGGLLEERQLLGEGASSFISHLRHPLLQ